MGDWQQVVENWVSHANGIHYLRAKVLGKVIRESLKTKDSKVAKISVMLAMAPSWFAAAQGWAAKSSVINPKHASDPPHDSSHHGDHANTEQRKPPRQFGIDRHQQDHRNNHQRDGNGLNEYQMQPPQCPSSALAPPLKNLVWIHNRSSEYGKDDVIPMCPASS